MGAEAGREGRVLLGHRSPTKRAFPDVWDLPGGVVEDGESEMQALARELHEELGVRIATRSTSPMCRVVVEPSGEPTTLSAWLVTAWHGTPANLAPDEHLDIGWFAVSELPPLVHEVVRGRLVRAARSIQPDD